MNEILTSNDFDKSNKIIFYFGSAIALLLIVGALVLFILYLRPPTVVKNLGMQKAIPAQEKLDRKAWVLEVLYPEDSASQAATVLNQLKAEGYYIQATGSANPDQKTITLRVKPELRQKSEELLENLSKFLKITTFTADFVSETANAQLILNHE